MAAYSATYGGSSGGRVNLLPFVLAVLVLGFVAAVAVITSSHAVLRHGSEAEAIRKCIDQNGAYQVWIDRGGDYYKLCKLGDGRWGAQIIAKQGDKLFEKTAYVKGDGTWNTIMRWLQDKCATRFNGTIQ